MKLKVIKIFRDKYNRSTRYMPGEIVDFAPKRAQDLIERGLAEAAEKVEPKEPANDNPDTPSGEDRKSEPAKRKPATKPKAKSPQK